VSLISERRGLAHIRGLKRDHGRHIRQQIVDALLRLVEVVEAPPSPAQKDCHSGRSSAFFESLGTPFTLSQRIRSIEPYLTNAKEIMMRSDYSDPNTTIPSGEESPTTRPEAGNEAAGLISVSTCCSFCTALHRLTRPEQCHTTSLSDARLKQPTSRSRHRFSVSDADVLFEGDHPDGTLLCFDVDCKTRSWTGHDLITGLAYGRTYLRELNGSQHPIPYPSCHCPCQVKGILPEQIVDSSLKWAPTAHSGRQKSAKRRSIEAIADSTATAMPRTKTQSTPSSPQSQTDSVGMRNASETEPYHDAKVHNSHFPHETGCATKAMLGLCNQNADATSTGPQKAPYVQTAVEHDGATTTNQLPERSSP
jgi:hypothetical protein